VKFSSPGNQEDHPHVQQRKGREMMLSLKSDKKLRQLLCALFLLLLPLLVSVLACEMPGSGDESARQTAIAQNVQATVNAEDAATLQAKQTDLASKETEMALQLEETVMAQEATLQAQQTALKQQETQATATPEATATQAEPSPQAAFEPMLIVDWDKSSFVPLFSGCEVEDTPCWKTDDDYDKHGGGTMAMVSEESIFIDPDWPSPYLVFWHKYDFQREASISVLVSDQWEYLKLYDKTKSLWTQEVLDLRKYKGESIIIQFSLQGRDYVRWWQSSPKSEWFVQEVQLIPDYSP
jgi:hypothetical protein